MKETRVRLVAFVALAALLGGCSDAPSVSPSAVSPGLEARFDAELARSLSDYSREILRDKKITGAEYQDADSHYIECVNVSFPGHLQPAFYSTVQPDGSLAHAFKGTDEDLALFDRVEPACLEEYMAGGGIQSLYWDSVKNPQGLPLDELIVQCLVKKGLVNRDTYGVDQLNADAAQDLNEDTGDGATQPTDLDLSKGEAFNCYAFQS